MEKEILNKFDEQETKLNAIYESVEKTRKYFLITMFVSVAAIIVPLLALILVIPFFLRTITASYGGLL
ncbi:MAG: hypothetical protein OEV93_02950 [Candidatus Moranbacteria bacterium]|nr:hypothetical protein [Candidatus Moranbacteria bacterium]